MPSADEVRERIAALGFDRGDTETLAEHFEDAERRRKLGHGFSRLEWLERLEGFDPRAAPVLQTDTEGFERWHAAGTIGYVALRTVVEHQIAARPEHARVVVVEECFPTGMLGHYARRLAEGGLVAALTATSPARLGHPDGGPKLAGTNPLAIAIPSSETEPLVADVSMGRVTYGDVLAGRAAEEELVPFGGEHGHKAFALALGLQLFVDALVREPGHAAVLVVARPESDPVPALRAAATGVRLPGDA
jgi:(2R)-3-sulfolactate dehydrogenase (NADP+)